MVIINSHTAHAKKSDLRPIEEIAAKIKSEETPIEIRMRLLFEARHIGGDAAVNALIGGLESSTSVLLRHEIAYVLGQLGIHSDVAIGTLKQLLKDDREDAMVRHEAAEGLAALGVISALPLVAEYLNDSCVPLRETCILAHKSLESRLEHGPAAKNEFNTVDPTGAGEYVSSTTGAARAALGISRAHLSRHSLTFNCNEPVSSDVYELKPSEKQSMSEDELGALMKNDEASLWDRYEALFMLRNLKTDKSTRLICEAMEYCENGSEVFRHEAAFVLGQIQEVASVPALIKALGTSAEHGMVRHEAALALGSVAGNIATDCANKELSEARALAMAALTKHSTTEPPVVYESCKVALFTVYEEDRQRRELAEREAAEEEKERQMMAPMAPMAPKAAEEPKSKAKDDQKTSAAKAAGC